MNTQTHTQTHTPMIIAHNFFAVRRRGGRAFFAVVGALFKGLSAMKDTFSPPGAAAPGPPLFFPRGCRPWTPLLLLAMRPVVPAVASGRQLVPVVANWCQGDLTSMGAHRRTRAHTGATTEGPRYALIRFLRFWAL